MSFEKKKALITDEDFAPKLKYLKFLDVSQLVFFFDNYLGLHFNYGVVENYLESIDVVVGPFILRYKELQGLYELANDLEDVKRRLNLLDEAEV